MISAKKNKKYLLRQHMGKYYILRQPLNYSNPKCVDKLFFQRINCCRGCVTQESKFNADSCVTHPRQHYYS